ncbi:hypothetical protein PENSTE_c001G04516 [Penicillium steckii]|uniref:Uncharacterized protein n=1 Tax=Penicillium steckii TaxID=303698 RepID=A0A1V6TZX4_9EURO|nr:hypothetical protein PENSTE_c001G04516 [Penicillium steckii]
MPATFPRISYKSMILMGLCTVASVYAHPIRETATIIEKGALAARDPRLIPDTEHYLADVLDSIGVGEPEPDTSSQASYTPTPTIKAEQEQPVNIEATPSSTGASVKFTTVIHNGNDRPIENIQIGSGWDGKKELRASDLPMIFDAVYKEMESRFRNVLDSSDELGLGL